MSEKPTTQPKTLIATDVDIASYKQCCEEMGRFVTLGHKPALSMIARIENDAKTIEALAGTGFTSGCADGHAPIRYSGEKCPLCEARKRVDGLESLIVAWNGDDNNHCGQSCGCGFGCPHGNGCLYECGCDDSPQFEACEALTVEAQAILSRPSSDPGAGEVGK